MDKYLGKLLDNRYEILQIIGTGGMAVVYKARCHRLNRLVAVKVLKDEFAQDEEFRNRFRAESQAVAILSHPNLVSVYDVSRSNAVEYIVMELIDGMTLKQFMERKGVLTCKEAVHFVTQILKALDHAHEKGIIHRDIKPHNVMLLRDGTIKVTDFGIARFAATQGTLNNEALGSVHYISPEQAKGGNIDTRTDIYSTGVLLYEMITGRLPYEGDTPVSIAVQHINSMPLSPRDINPNIPEALERITMKAMCANINQRYASAEEMLQDLEAFRKNPAIVFDPVPASSETEPTQVVPVVDPENAATTVIPTDNDFEDDLFDEEEERKPKINFMLIGGIIAAIVFISGIIALATTLFGGDEAPELTVPNLLGKSYEEVLENEQYKQFKIVKEDQEHSDLYEKDQIMEQEPNAGESIPENGEILVVISLGSEEIVMENLVNLSEEQAKEKMDLLGIDAEYILEESDTVPEGYVIRTEPADGAKITEDTNVKIFVSGSNESAMVPVPHLIGMSVEDATDELASVGLKMGTVREVESSREKGTIVYQSVKENTEVERESSINVQVSSGEVPEETQETDSSESENRDEQSTVVQKPTEQKPTQSETTQKPAEQKPTQSETTQKPAEQKPTQSETTQKPAEQKPEEKPAQNETAQVPEQKPEQTAKSRTITIKLPQSPESFTLSAKINGAVVYSGSHHARDGSAVITVYGNGTKDVSIYIDDKLYNEVSVTFD